jgi:hypothetical protein
VEVTVTEHPDVQRRTDGAQHHQSLEIQQAQTRDMQAINDVPLPGQTMLGTVRSAPCSSPAPRDAQAASCHGPGEGAKPKSRDPDMKSIANAHAVRGMYYDNIIKTGKPSKSMACISTPVPAMFYSSYDAEADRPADMSRRRPDRAWKTHPHKSAKTRPDVLIFCRQSA